MQTEVDKVLDALPRTYMTCRECYSFAECEAARSVKSLILSSQCTSNVYKVDALRYELAYVHRFNSRHIVNIQSI